MPNAKLEPFGVLAGEWKTTGSHPSLSGAVLHGRAGFAWIEDGAFLQMRAVAQDEGIPNSVVIFGSDDSTDAVSMLYFDERGVARIYQTSFIDNVWKIWRDDPGFSQRFTGTLEADHNTIHALWELARDGKNWARDLELTYTRVK